MEQDGQDIITSFNNRFTTNKISIFKIILPYLNSSLQNLLTIYIKFSEFQYTLNLLKQDLTFAHHSNESIWKSTNDSNHFEQCIPELCSKIIPFCNQADQERLKQIQNSFQSFQTIHELTETMELMKALMPESDDHDSVKEDNSDSSSSFQSPDLMEALMGMLSPDQKKTFDLFNQDFFKQENSQKSEKKEDSHDKGLDEG